MVKVLIIDDDEMMLKGLSNYLSDAGFKTITTADGPQGIMLYNSEEPDIVVLDLGLPSLNGIEVLRQMRKHNPDAKVIIASGYESSTTTKEALANGAFAFIGKPFDVDKLIELINSALSS